MATVDNFACAGQGLAAAELFEKPYQVPEHVSYMTFLRHLIGSASQRELDCPASSMLLYCRHPIAFAMWGPRAEFQAASRLNIVVIGSWSGLATTALQALHANILLILLVLHRYPHEQVSRPAPIQLVHHCAQNRRMLVVWIHGGSTT